MRRGFLILFVELIRILVLLGCLIVQWERVELIRILVLLGRLIVQWERVELIRLLIIFFRCLIVRWRRGFYGDRASFLFRHIPRHDTRWLRPRRWADPGKRWKFVRNDPRWWYIAGFRRLWFWHCIQDHA
jgi:hypothetical protein